MSLQIDDRHIFNSIPHVVEPLKLWAERLVSYLHKKEETESLYKTFKPDYASAITFRPSLANILCLDTVHSVGNCTITALNGKVGPAWIVVKNDTTSGKVITFGTGFAATGTLTGTANKTAVVGFISDGNMLYEVSRVTGL